MRQTTMTKDEKDNVLLRRKRISPHKLRHFYATEQADRGMNPKKLANILGQASTSTTLDFYYDNDSTVEESDLGI